MCVTVTKACPGLGSGIGGVGIPCRGGSRTIVPLRMSESPVGTAREPPWVGGVIPPHTVIPNLVIPQLERRMGCRRWKGTGIL